MKNDTLFATLTATRPTSAFADGQRRASRRSAHATISLLLAASSLGCAREGVDLGGDTLTQDLQRGSRCVDSTIVEENVVVSAQEELDALAGCEQIRGNLIVRAFAGADLTPLGALRDVQGQFALGVQENWDEIFGFGISDRLDLQVDLLRAGWVQSLDGVQALEHADAIFLRGLPDADLTAFESLASLGGGGAALSGLLILQQNLRLVDLTGLESLAGVTNLVVTLSPEVTNLAGAPMSALRGLSLYTSRALTDLSALSTLTRLDSLTLFDIGATDLNALAGIQAIESLGVSENLSLVDASGLNGLESADFVNISNNAALQTLPSFVNFTQQPSTIAIVDNPELERVVLDFTNAPTSTYTIAGFVGQPGVETYEIGVDVIDVRRNGKLQTLSVPAGLTKVNLMLVGENPRLASADLGSLRELGQLSITSNAVLDPIALGDVSQVGFLQVTDNPLLSPAVFDGVQTFAREISGNAE